MMHIFNLGIYLNRRVIIRVVTQWVVRSAFENDTVSGEEECSLCWQDVWSSQKTPSGLLSTVRV